MTDARLWCIMITNPALEDTACAAKGADMSPKDRKAVRRTAGSFVYGGVSLVLFFPYESLRLNFIFFLLALCGVLFAAFNLIGINRQHVAVKSGACGFDRHTHVFARLAWWLTFVPFVVALLGLIGTGILACSIYLS